MCVCVTELSSNPWCILFHSPLVEFKCVCVEMEAQSSDIETQYDLKERKKENSTTSTIINQTAARLAFQVDSSVGFKWAGAHVEWAWWLNQCKLITVSAGKRRRQRRSPQCRLCSTFFGSPEGHIMWDERRRGEQGYVAVIGCWKKQQAQTKLLISYLQLWGITGKSRKVKNRIKGT